MVHKHRFSLGFILLLLTLVAVATRPGWFVTIFLIESIAVFFCAEVLVHNLPKAIQRSIQDNGRRADGTKSSRRARIEEKAVRKVARDIVFALVLVLVPTNLLLWYVNSEVIPLSIGFDAIASMRSSEAEWKENLRDEERELDRWAESRRLSTADLSQRKQTLWRSWPLILVGAVVWGGVSFSAFAVAYWHSLRELKASIEYRAEKYALLDLHSAVEGETQPRESRIRPYGLRGRSKTTTDGR